MPYDPRPTDEGGNKGIDRDFSRRAPEGQFRVIGVDTFDGGDWVSKDCDTLEDAQEHVRNETKGQQMKMMHIYDDEGKHCDSGGSF